jgi:hypothetical protein
MSCAVHPGSPGSINTDTRNGRVTRVFLLGIEGRVDDRPIIGLLQLSARRERKQGDASECWVRLLEVEWGDADAAYGRVQCGR